MTDVSAVSFLSPETVAENYRAVVSHIAEVCTRNGRNPDEVRLLPVSKFVPTEALIADWPALYDAGCRTLGENRVQEAEGKAIAYREAFAATANTELAAPRIAIIGPLQTNKAGHLVNCADEFEALDRPKVAKALERRLAEANRTLDVLIQVNTSNEPQKAGIAPGELDAFVEQFGDAGPWPHLRLKGLMTMAIRADNSDNPEADIRRSFSDLREMRDRLAANAPDGVELTQLSMGMSGDYEYAIAEGATTVRVGRAIFGARHT